MKLCCLFLLLCLTGCAELKPSWQGFWIGPELVAPFDKNPRSGDVSIEGTAILGLGEKNCIQFGIWGNPDAQGYRIAIDRKLF